MNERSIFLDALELTDPDERRKYLDQACGVDQELRGQVEELLVSHNDASSFLEKPPEGLAATIAAGTDETVGESLGGDSLEFLDPTDKPGCLGTLSQYEVVEVVGRGGMGVVLRAYDTKLNRVVAIKVMAPELAANAMAVKRFLREARAAAAVSHDHVVTIHAIEADNRPPFIVMEFVDGQSLQEKIDRDGALDLNEILRIGLQMARGLDAAHEQGLVHRDIKPANILLENGVERVKLTDFGLARAVDDVSVTQTGQIAGTPQFMSPEQAQGHALDARSDVFSLGSVLYTMSTGRPPFRAETALAMLRRVTDDEPRSICEVNANIPDWLEAIVFKLLAKEPDERFQSAAEVAELLSQHLAHLQHPTTAPKPQPVVPHIGGNSLRKPKTQTIRTSDESLARGGFRTTIAAGLIAAVVCLGFLGAIIHISTDRGELIIEVDDPDIQVQIIQGGREVKLMKEGDYRITMLRSGEYNIHVLGETADSFDISDDRVVISRGVKKVVTIYRKPRQLSIAGVAKLTPHSLFSISTDGKLIRLHISPSGADHAVVHDLGEAFRDVEGLTTSDDGTLYAAVHAERTSHLYAIDVATGESRKIGDMNAAEVDGLAWRDGKLFAVTSHLGGGKPTLLEVDPATAKTKQVGGMLRSLGDLDSLTFDHRGRLLTTNGTGTGDKFYQLDERGDAPPTPLAPTPPIIPKSRDIEGLTIAADGKLYGVTHPNPEGFGQNRSYLVRIDPATFAYENLGLLDFGTYCLAAGRTNAVEPFVIRSDRGEQEFASLASAVAAAKSGDTIEVRGNGPFVTAPIVLRQRALTIRACERFRPVIELSPDVKDATPLIETHAALVVEGLKFVRTPVVETDDEDQGYHLIRSLDAPLVVANCEFANRFVSIRATRTPVCVIRNCLFAQSQAALSYTPPTGGWLWMHNNVHHGEGLLHLHYDGTDGIEKVKVDVHHNTIVARPLWLFLHGLPPSQQDGTPPIRVIFNDNIVDAVRPMIHFSRSGDLLQSHEPLSAEDMAHALKRTLAWEEGYNLYNLPNGYLATGTNSQPKSGPAFSIKTNDQWQRFWGVDQKGVLFGRANFAGGDARKRDAVERQFVIPGDFRLRGGPGASAASDGYDLGVTENYVGPGEGYDLWRATSDYQIFRENLESHVPMPEPNRKSRSIEEIKLLHGQTDILGALEFLPDGKSLVTGSKESLYHWDLATGNVNRKIPVDSPVKGVAALPDGKHVVTSHFDGAVTLWNLSDDLPVRSFSGHTKPVFAISVSSDGKRLLTGGHDGLVRLWDIETGGAIHSFQETYCNAVAMSDDGRFAAHGGSDSTLIVWDVATGDVIQRVQDRANFDTAAFSPDGRHLASGDDDGLVHIWEVATGKLVYHLNGHTAQVTSLHFTPDGRHFISGSFDKTIRVFELATGREVARAECDKHYATKLAVAPDGRTLASGGGYWLELEDEAKWEFAQRTDGHYAIHLWRLPAGVFRSDSEKNSLGMTLRLIPPDKFEMGTADEDIDAIPANDEWFFADFVPERRAAETPRHKVTISRPFEMSEHEVTVGQFRQFVAATGYKTTAEQEGEGYGWRNGEWREGVAYNWQTPGFEQTDDHPVCNVSWEDATEFCRWLSEQEGVIYRLPTEAEWEYACRAGTTTLFTTGDDPVTLQGAANLADRALRKEQPSVTWAVDWDDGFPATAPVGSFQPNAFGLQDMHGNVWEWCQDVYDDEWYETSPAIDPLRRGSGRHVFRGGGFDNWPGFLRAADRYSSHSETIITDWAGFRVVREMDSHSTGTP